MKSTFVMVKGILLVPTPDETYKAMKFSVDHETEEQLFGVIDKVMVDITQMRGLSIIADETKKARDPNNMQFWPMERFHHLEVQTKSLSMPPAQGTIQ